MEKETEICRLCDHRSSIVLKEMPGYIEGTKYDVHECPNCLASFVSPLHSLKEEYNIIYGISAEKKSGESDYYHYLARGVKKLKNPLKSLEDYCAIFWGVIKAIKDNHIKEGAKILEIGSGFGYLTYAFNKAEYVCVGLDYSSKAVDFANEMFGKNFAQGTIEDFANNNVAKYDVAIATEVIEHVADPVSFVENSLKVLKPGGILILTTPIKDIHPSGTIWETAPAPVHLWWLSEKGMEAIGRKLNSKVSFVDFTEYTKNKIWHINYGAPGRAPNNGAVMDRSGNFLKERTKGLKERGMSFIPPWLYIKMVGLYHKMHFLEKKSPIKKMYGMCVIFYKN